MALNLWKNSDGRLVKSEKGQLIKCDRCPCIKGCYIQASAACYKVISWGGDGSTPYTEPVDCKVTPAKEKVTCLGDNVGDKVTFTVNVTTEVPAICMNILVEYFHYMGEGEFVQYWGEGGNWTERTSFTFTVTITRYSADYVYIDIQEEPGVL